MTPDEPLLAGRYRLIAELGRGGMGIVYRALDVRLNREIALKVLPQVATDEESRRRFVREARTAAAVNHPNIATVYDVWENASGRVFLAMELIEGKTLRKHLASGPLSPEETTRIARQIASGLARAHEKGIIHRDLKPENVIVTRAGGVKILDFGLAKVTEPISTDTALEHQETETQHGRVMGTPGYMSPEQSAGRPVDARTDVYALGIVIHELLTGEIPSLYGSGRTVSDARLASIVARCVARAPEQRWRNAGEVALALDTPPGKAIPALPTGRRRSLVTVLSAALVSVIALAIAVLATRARHSAHAANDAGTSRASASTSSRPTTLADLPLPATTVPEALTEYKTGIQLLRDDSYTNALHHFQRTVDLDPSMALGHLRLAVTGGGTAANQEILRRELAKAASLRAQLGERDQALLEALEPMLGRAEPDDGETIARLEAAHARFPLDEEFLMWLAVLTMGDSARSAAAARRATELDPRDAAAWEVRGRGLAEAGDIDGARRARATCSAVSVESSDCYLWLGLLDGAAGRCEDMEHEARREADIDAEMGNLNLARAAFALERPESVVREALARYVGASREEERAQRQLRFDALMAIMSGRFDDALHRLDDAVRALESTPTVRHEALVDARITATRVDLQLETGDGAAAQRTARAFIDRYALLEQGRTGDPLPYWWLLRLAGEPLEPRRSAWTDARLRTGGQGSLVWTSGWAMPATTADEANEAISARERDPRLTLPREGDRLHNNVEIDTQAGHAYLLAGKPADAIPYLRRGATNCFALEDPLEHVHAELDLARALAQTGDTPGACGAYQKVIARWGHAKPRSASADAAKVEAARLRCGPR